MKVENDIELADVSEVFVKDLNEMVDGFKSEKFVIILVDDCYEIKACISEKRVDLRLQ